MPYVSGVKLTDDAEQWLRVVFEKRPNLLGNSVLVDICRAVYNALPAEVES